MATGASDRRSRGNHVAASGTTAASVPTEPMESQTITFEWPLTGLQSIFEGSKADVKSKVIKSVPFGGGKWNVLFYAQSGIEQVSHRRHNGTV